MSDKYRSNKNKRKSRASKVRDFEEESKRRKDFKRRKQDLREQEYENQEEYTQYNY